MSLATAPRVHGPDRWTGLRPDLRARLTPPMPPDRFLGWLLPLLVTGFAAYLRFHRLAIPKALVFDEVYYAHDADSLLHHGVELGPTFNHGLNANGQSVNDFIVHPPVGKWMIAVGEWLFPGHPKTLGGTIYPSDTFGWRFSAALVGTLAVLIIARTVRRMTRSTLLGTAAGLLLALDGLEFVQSRIATLDIFLMFWVLAAFACLVADRDWGRRRLADRLELIGHPVDYGPRIGFRPWRIGAAVCLGLATGTKWNGALFAVAFAVLVLLWDVGARRTGGSHKPVRAALRHDALPVVLLFFVLVAALYVAAWGGWFATSTGYDRHWASDPGNHSHWHLLFLPLPWIGDAMPKAVRSWMHYQHEIWNFHQSLHPTHADPKYGLHPYQSHPQGWLVLERPVSYYFASPQSGQSGCKTAGGCSQEILALGTPAIWWASIGALIASVWFWIAKRDWRAGAALLGTGVAILGWIPSEFHHRTMFLFYALPALPFMVIALTLCIGYALAGPDASPTRQLVGASGSGAYLLLVIMNFFYLYPVLAAGVLSYSHWHDRIWFPSWF
ncbi:MAG: dolichyl-phosphate-mannose--protein mannosyltransferase [Actinomycetes bacterium]